MPSISTATKGTCPGISMRYREGGNPGDGKYYDALWGTPIGIVILSTVLRGRACDTACDRVNISLSSATVNGALRTLREGRRFAQISPYVQRAAE